MFVSRVVGQIVGVVSVTLANVVIVVAVGYGGVVGQTTTLFQAWHDFTNHQSTDHQLAGRILVNIRNSSCQWL